MTYFYPNGDAKVIMKISDEDVLVNPTVENKNLNPSVHYDYPNLDKERIKKMLNEAEELHDINCSNRCSYCDMSINVYGEYRCVSGLFIERLKRIISE